MKIILLGFNKNHSKIYSFLKKKKFKVIEIGQNKINLKMIDKDDFILSFGYRKIIKNNIIKKLHRPIVNLHISYLPYNRGSHPNFWSFIENTQQGVTIHEIDKGIDTGKIIFQKRIRFKIDKLLTFKKTYKILIKEIELLFFRHHKTLINFSYKSKKQKKNGTYHSKKELPKKLKFWNQKIKEYLNT